MCDLKILQNDYIYKKLRCSHAKMQKPVIVWETPSVPRNDDMYMEETFVFSFRNYLKLVSYKDDRQYPNANSVREILG